MSITIFIVVGFILGIGEVFYIAFLKKRSKIIRSDLALIRNGQISTHSKIVDIHSFMETMAGSMLTRSELSDKRISDLLAQIEKKDAGIIALNAIHVSDIVLIKDFETGVQSVRHHWFNMLNACGDVSQDAQYIVFKKEDVEWVSKSINFLYEKLKA